MIKPSLDQLVEKVDSKYTLVIISSRRGREIQAGTPKQVDSRSNKPVTIALEELVAGKLFFERGKTTGR
ncbi:MAG TPA: DNA-directed RNA polymerase subunit omega [Symbiobacteriaceae bacterium]|nr:DNA-directed RNA polymerase subunit omega [Symbiobacteriaceae bacterium]